ncbi:unnamed protein product [Parnassius apollo]|uniref:(apollo) hypothetical protein n=1 Tax=Parnassius apollo TaxID=110799 RepID=A0A8S3Y1W4_PARAO|nr:unnamed protein product [Parnassius apollo]
MSKQEEITTDFKPSETWRIVKNVVVISLAFMVQFTAYNGAANLQSSINAEAGLGTASLAAVYAGLVFSSIFLPVIVIKWLGTKWAMVLSFLSYMPYIAAQLLPRFWTLVPAGLILGLGAGPLWCSKCTYLSVVSVVHSKISNISSEALLSRFLGVFSMIFHLNQIWGNLISSLVLSSGDNEAAVTALNETLIPKFCGANFLPSADAGEALQTQPPERIQMIAGLYLVCIAGAALISAVGVDSMKRYDNGRSRSHSGQSSLALLVATMKLLVEPNQLMLIIINVFIGLQQAFFGADFSAAFVSCAIGTGTVGFVMMTYGAADAIGCVVSGYLAKVTGRLPLLCTAALIQTGLFVAILIWRPHHNEAYALYSLAVLWGLCDALWVVQIKSFYGVLFLGREEAAFSNFVLWESVGYIVAYIISPHLRASTKTYLLIALLIIGVSLYFVVEYRNRKARKKLEEKKKELHTIGCNNIAFQNLD